MTIYLLIAILLAVIYIGVELFSKPLFAIYAKAFASMGFIVLGLVSFNTSSFEPMIYVIIGLLFGMIGDVVLALRPLRPKEEDETIILGGIFTFSMGHIFYLIFLLSLSQLHFISIIISIVMTIVVVIGSYMMKFEMGKTRIPSYIYSALIFLMIGQAIVFTMNQGANQGTLLLLVGAILFGISDLILAPIYYKRMHTKLMVSSNLITYYLAQILIAYSLFFL
ncbi:MAG: lysoplasmalogenase [Firmicutes bacterium]|nr:lysoplasmalogenase [Bacillota bacterium]